MLTIHVVGDELYDEDRNEFINGFEGDLLACKILSLLIKV